MTANETQVGGTHYQSIYQHWDLCVKIPLDYLEGCTTKHVTRWRKKLGIQDLQKALHYLDKLIEVYKHHYSNRMSHDDAAREVDKFTQANHLSILEHTFIYILCTYGTKKDLEQARKTLMQILERATQEIKKIEEMPS